jgi:hypothetical protein
MVRGDGGRKNHSHNQEGRHGREGGGGGGGSGPKYSNVIGIQKGGGDVCVCVCVCEDRCGWGFWRSIRRVHRERKRRTLRSSICRQEGGEGGMEPGKGNHRTEGEGTCLVVLVRGLDQTSLALRRMEARCLALGTISMRSGGKGDAGRGDLWPRM